MLLGSGSSVQLGMPSVAKLDALVKSQSSTWARRRGCQDYFATLWRLADEYFKPDLNRRIRAVNFETVLGDLLALSHWLTPAPDGDHLRFATSTKRMPF